MFTVIFLVDSHHNINGVDAADQENLNICIGCHPTLTDILPKGHEAIKDANPTSCKKCHTTPDSTKTFEWLNHFKHYTAADNEITCDACHLPGKEEKSATPQREAQPKTLPPGIDKQWKPYFKSWAASGYMDNEHARGGITCATCHGTLFAFEIPSLEKCLKCHKKYEPASEKNSDEAPNPHRSHLESPPCSLCHKAHEASVNYCNNANCHNFNFKFSYSNTK